MFLIPFHSTIPFHLVLYTIFKTLSSIYMQKTKFFCLAYDFPF